MDKIITINNITEVESLRSQVIDNAIHSSRNLRILSSALEGLDLLYEIKFSEIGTCPVSSNPINLIEQINQTFTTLVAIKAVEELIINHPEHTPYRLCLTNAPGYDIESIDKQVVCEVFAATHPTSNNKIRKDILKLMKFDSPLKYIFFYSKKDYIGLDKLSQEFPEINIVRIKDL